MKTLHTLTVSLIYIYILFSNRYANNAMEVPFASHHPFNQAIMNSLPLAYPVTLYVVVELFFCFLFFFLINQTVNHFF